jgi:hypothetical protein
LKKYCECFELGVFCSIFCRCIDCGNVDEKTRAEKEAQLKRTASVAGLDESQVKKAKTDEPGKEVVREPPVAITPGAG